MIDFFLELPHLGKQGVEVGIRVSHFGRNFVEAVELRLDVGYGYLNVAENRFGFV